MSELERWAAVAGCQQAIHRFYLALDASDFDTVAASMAGHGVWHRQGRALQGPEQVRQALAERPAGRRTAHLVQNLVVDVTAPDRATARYMTLVYRVDGAEAAGPVALPPPLSISMYEERLCRSAQGDWLVEEKRSRRVFGA
ncbi:MAG: nuclear transport factor 2 family protein [Pigmentiphaga sp.]|uniref:nuclear transport factor 2 family protein n=1 Tax=Pigmentiphaga sp. TaxID=1977564 RepID=UPI0029A52C33|nr:nuclear transport factor 2 family protein [Pigmentiphaga sp.]MDX3906344.1 nuclear transport factor 2 family protein [Pigmentiphaga sp.]